MDPRKPQQKKSSAWINATFKARLQERLNNPRRLNINHDQAETRHTRQILATDLLRLCVPEFNSTSGELPTDLGYDVGLRIGNQKLSLLADIDRPARSPRYSVNELKDMCEQDPGQFVAVYTDGSFFRRENRSGYGVYWPEQPMYQSFGPVKLPGEPSSAKAEAYAILVALLEILAVDLKKAGNVENKFCIYSDCIDAMNGIMNWLEWWHDPESSDARITQLASVKELREIYRVAAGLLWELRRLGVCVIFKHVSAHTGVPGNEAADSMARIGSCLQKCCCKTKPYFDKNNDEAVNDEAVNDEPRNNTAP